VSPPDVPIRPPKNVLLLQLGEIGDVVLATPTFRATKETFPEARLSVLVRKPCATLLETDRHLDEILEVAKSSRKISEIGKENFDLARKLRRAGYDLVIDLRTGDRGAILAGFTGAPSRIARKDPGEPFWRKWMFTRLLPDQPPGPPSVHPGADHSLRLVRTLGIDTADSIPRLSVSEKASVEVQKLLDSIGIRAEDRWITINPCSRRKYKEWAHERWAEVADALWSRHRLSAIFVGAPEEAEEAGEIVRRCSERAFNLAGRTTLGELAALLANTAMHLGVDSAPPHIAAAVGAPVVTIFGPSNWKAWIVQDATHRVVTSDRGCSACGRMGCADSGRSLCLGDLRADTVVQAAEEVLAAIPRCGSGDPADQFPREKSPFSQ
jgi:predicted lipopolysaccharide heptosyltransferase III